MAAAEFGWRGIWSIWFIAKGHTAILEFIMWYYEVRVCVLSRISRSTPLGGFPSTMGNELLIEKALLSVPRKIAAVCWKCYR